MDKAEAAKGLVDAGTDPMRLEHPAPAYVRSADKGSLTNAQFPALSENAQSAGLR